MFLCAMRAARRQNEKRAGEDAYLPYRDIAPTAAHDSSQAPGASSRHCLWTTTYDCVPPMYPIMSVFRANNTGIEY